MKRSMPKTVMVTGAGSGIGQAIAIELGLEEGAAVAVIDNRELAAEATARTICQAGGRAIPILCDVSSQEAVCDTVERIETDLGPLEGQVNCAGIWMTSRFLELTPADWELVMRVNAFGVFFSVQAAGRVMVPRKSGVIINISSAVGALTARPFHAHYGASKAAVNSVTRSAAAAFGPHGIRVNAVCPGAIDTPMFSRVRAQPEEIIGPLLKQIPLGRVGQPSEIASVVMFLLSSDASYVNGQSLNVCGGLQMN
jgi:NAD(P)-dependent dehydrogenase (short-subunit alcohol dehydrogenase family)